MDNVNEDMKMNRKVSFLRLSDRSEKMNMFTEMYLIDNIVYSRTDIRIDGDFIAPAKWIKVPQDYHDIVDADTP